VIQEFVWGFDSKLGKFFDKYEIEAAVSPFLQSKVED
jgi:hypothetical protein